VLKSLKETWLLDGGLGGIDDLVAEQSSRLGLLVSRLQQSNVRLESTGLLPTIQPQTLLSYHRI
jgi:hypothetical protein